MFFLLRRKQGKEEETERKEKKIANPCDRVAQETFKERMWVTSIRFQEICTQLLVTSYLRPTEQPVKSNLLP